MNHADSLSIAGLVTGVCERLGVRYLLGGSMASTALGEPRMTLDVDLVIDLEIGTVDRWIESLGPEFLIDRDWVRAEVERRGSFQLFHMPSLVRIDVFVPPWEGVHLWKWERRRRLRIDANLSLDVTAPEGIVLQKLMWYRAGGEVSDRQWRDVVGVLRAQRLHLQRDEMEAWATRCGVADLLARALVDAAAV